MSDGQDAMLSLPMRKLTMEELGRKSVEQFRQADKLPVIAVLENVRSAYNVGSVFRTADAFLLQSVYLCGYTAVPPHKQVAKTALGAENTVEWKHFRHTAQAIASLKSEGYSVFAVEQAIDSIPLHRLQTGGRKLAVIFGNEVTGVDESTLELTEGAIEIPQLGMKHSLNIATAAGVVLWELARRHLALPEQNRSSV
ncbi:MAG TPA: RNA methyltransferase [Chitinophagaceae bacterium]